MDDTENDTLFSLESRKKINGLKFSTAKKVVFTNWIAINGHDFDADDVYETLHETSSGDSYLTDRKMIEALKSIHVLEYEGHRDGMSARMGANFDHFMAWLKQKRKKADRSGFAAIAQNRLLHAAPHLVAAAKNILRSEGNRTSLSLAMGELEEALKKAKPFPCEAMFWFYSDHERRRYQKVPVLILSKSATMYRIEALEDINAPTLSLKKGKRSQVDKKYINLSNNEMEA